MIAIIGSIVGMSVPVAAQYTSLATVSSGSKLPSAEELERQIEEARWNLGLVRIQPWIGLRDISFVARQDRADGLEQPDPSQRTDDDGELTATAGAGLRLYVPFGKVTVAAHALPEYVWWQDADQKSGVAGRYGAGLFVHGNRVHLGASYQQVENQGFFSAEVQELTRIATDTSHLGLELNIARGFLVFASFERIETRGDAGDDALFTLLDRDEEWAGAGARLKSHRGWSFGMQLRDGMVEFAPGARDLSHDAESVVVQAGFDMGKLSGELELERQEGTPHPGSQLAAFEEDLGALHVRWSPRDAFQIETFTERQRDFSVREGSSLIVRDDSGVRLFLGRDSLTVQFLAAEGENEYLGVADAAVSRREDVSTLGLSVGWRVGRLGSVQLNAQHRNIDVVGQPAFDREVTSLGLSVQLGELASRLSTGDSEAIW